ncbi:MAG: GIY-YIG nuclease family protein [Desulfuromonadales bacterium]|nr:GIY-YIG nuclease family protein [Desulfuromonadales bacterium]
MSREKPATLHWQVYILLCSDHSLYTGITTDIARRFQQHVEGRGAKYFRGRQPLQVVYLEAEHSRASASRREAFIKGLKREEKERLLFQQKSEAP